MNKPRETGILRAYDEIRGYGFIRRRAGKDAFVYFGDFVNKSVDASALIGTPVEFEIVEGPKGPRALTVIIAG